MRLSLASSVAADPLALPLADGGDQGWLLDKNLPEKPAVFLTAFLRTPGPGGPVMPIIFHFINRTCG